MNKIILSFLTTSLAGFSTLFGVIPCFLKEKNKDKIISFSLAFSSGIMLTISLISLIPESVSLLTDRYLLFPTFIITFIFIVIGIIFSSFIDQKVEEKFSKNKLYKLGIISIIVLVLHNIPEDCSHYVSQ